jgi:predicted AAA+ superfamily ATPase
LKLFRSTAVFQEKSACPIFFCPVPGEPAKQHSFNPRTTFPDATLIDLSESQIYREYLRNPSIISEQRLKPIVVIDEVQKLPEILDEVHRLIENENLTFLLTGGSVRKLKRGGANLLAGRAWWAEMFPLTSKEIPDFDLLTYLNRGGLPSVYPSNDYVEGDVLK